MLPIPWIRQEELFALAAFAMPFEVHATHPSHGRQQRQTRRRSYQLGSRGKKIDRAEVT
jgi:hypothetical protein